MAIAKPLQAVPLAAPAAPLSTAPLYQRLDTLLAGGGDARLALSRPDQRNAYGCTPYPRPELLDFASSTASVISGRGYARAERARAAFLARSALAGAEQAFQESIDQARAALSANLGLADAEIVFAPSGTDAQLQALFLAKAMLGGPLVCIIVGADQTGGGTAHTARGRHFSDSTACGVAVPKGMPIAGLAERVTAMEIPFCDTDGHVRSNQEMDHAVLQAIEAAIGGGAKVLLQIMDCSKLGRRNPSDDCVAEIAARWPQKLRVIVDACQMRLSRARLGRYLEQGFLALITGSKYFGGPPFSGALLVPPARALEIDAIGEVPAGLNAYGSRFDWPLRWAPLRDTFSGAANYGQWLRWQAALEEMQAYFAVPVAFREQVLGAFAGRVPQMLAAAPSLRLLADGAAPRDQGEQEMRHRTIFAVQPWRDGASLSAADCRATYHAMGRDLASHLPEDGDPADRRIAARLCQIGQPVLLADGAALRLSASARFVTDCWSDGADDSAGQFEKLAATIAKLDWLVRRNPDIAG